MDDKRFQQWTEILGEMRESRLAEIQNKQLDKSTLFEPEKLFKIYSIQLSSLLSRWWELEKESWEESPPADIKLGTDTLKNELESLVELELDKIKNEIDEIRESESAWKPDDFEEGKKSFEKICFDLIANFSLKIDSFLGKSKKDSGGGAATRARASGKPARSSGGGAGGFWLLFMFLIGLLIGAAPTVYYWDLARKSEDKINQEIGQVTADRKTLIEKLSIIQEAYSDLALGKSMNIPDLEKEIIPIQKSFAEKKEQLEKDYIRKQADLIKKIPAGDRLDKSLKNLKEAQDRQRNELDIQELEKTDRFVKELKKHKTILEGNQ